MPCCLVCRLHFKSLNCVFIWQKEVRLFHLIFLCYIREYRFSFIKITFWPDNIYCSLRRSLTSDFCLCAESSCVCARVFEFVRGVSVACPQCYQRLCYGAFVRVIFPWALHLRQSSNVQNTKEGESCQPSEWSWKGRLGRKTDFSPFVFRIDPGSRGST